MFLVNNNELIDELFTKEQKAAFTWAFIICKLRITYSRLKASWTFEVPREEPKLRSISGWCTSWYNVFGINHIVFQYNLCLLGWVAYIVDFLFLQS